MRRIALSQILQFVVGNAAVAASPSDTGEELFKLIPRDGAAYEVFGHSVAISSVTCVVGSAGDSDNGLASGSAYLFDTSTGQQVAKLLPSDGAAYDGFGISTAICGSTVIIGSYGDADHGPQSGSSYIFDSQSGQQVAKMLPSDGAAGDWFGYKVALSGTTAIVSAPMDDSNGDASGSAYLFDTSTGAQRLKLIPSDGALNDVFGIAVAISGTTAIVGAYGDDDKGAASGSAYLFDTSTGQQVAKLLAGDGAAYDSFGGAVAISGSIAIVGAYGDDDKGAASGSAYLFNTSTGEQVAKLLASDGAEYDSFGSAVAIRDSIAIVGAYANTDSGPTSGCAYLFNTSTGKQIAKLLPSDGAAYDSFGWAVAISEFAAIIGSYGDADNGIQSGSAYLFDSSPLRLESIMQSRARYDDPAGVVLTGAGFNSGALPAVFFDTVPATNVVVVDDAIITCDTPIVEPGQNNVDVAVANEHSYDKLEDAFTFTPALELTGNWAPGGDLTLTYLLDPGDSLFGIYGFDPEVALETPGYDGRLCILPFWKAFLVFGWPTDTWTQSFGLPDDPAISGLEFLIQGLVGPSFGNPKDAAWTHCGRVVIQ